MTAHTWQLKETGKWVRDDGATVVLAWQRTNLWHAYEPDPSKDCLARKRATRRRSGGRYFEFRPTPPSTGGPRRWTTAEAAMREVDRLFP